MRKIQSQGVHHITLVGADRQTSIDFWEGRARHAVRLRAAEPRQRAREPPLLRPGRRSPDHRLHRREPRSRPDAHVDRPRLRPPHRDHVSQAIFEQAALRLDERGRPAQRRRRTAGSWTRSTSTTRSACRSSSRPTASSRPSATPTSTCCSRRTGSGSSAATTTIAEAHLADAIELLVERSRESLSADRSPSLPGRQTL